MKLRLKFRVLKYDDEGLTFAHKYFEEELKAFLNRVANIYIGRAQFYMREDTGISKKSLQKSIQGKGINLKMRAWTGHIRAIVDNYGIRAGNVFPNWRPGGSLFKWAYRKIRRNEYGEPRKSRQVQKVFKAKKAKRTPVRKYMTWQQRRANSGFTGKGFGADSKYAKDSRGGTRKGRYGNSIRVNQFMEARRFAYMVARKIYFKGVQPTYWSRRAFAYATKNINSGLRGALNDVAVRINNKGRSYVGPSQETFLKGLEEARRTEQEITRLLNHYYTGKW
jgi:hypothetical protein